MFGYVRPYVPDLRVREHELYRAVYCGLCQSMGKHTGCASSFTLSYDFVFLAAVRMVLEQVSYSARPRRCGAHPLKKRAILQDNAALEYCARAATLLTEAKIADDIQDSKGMALRSRVLHPTAKRMCKKAFPDGDSPRDAVWQALEQLHALERAGCPSLDDTADCFGALLSDVFSWGLSGAAQKIAAQVGFAAGRFVYVLDAADDREQDLKSGNYNPLNIAPIDPAALSVAVRLDLSKLEAAVNLMDFTGRSELQGIIENILYKGMPLEADRVFLGKPRGYNLADPAKENTDGAFAARPNKNQEFNQERHGSSI